MTRAHAIDRLNHLATLMDRARASVREDVRELVALLDEAASLLTATGSTIRDAAGSAVPDQTLLAAAVRARASHAALHRVLREQMATLREQVSHADTRTDTRTDAGVRRTPPRTAGRRLDRLG